MQGEALGDLMIFLLYMNQSQDPQAQGCCLLIKTMKGFFLLEKDHPWVWIFHLNCDEL